MSGASTQVSLQSSLLLSLKNRAILIIRTRDLQRRTQWRETLNLTYRYQKSASMLVHLDKTKLLQQRLINWQHKKLRSWELEPIILLQRSSLPLNSIMKRQKKKITSLSSYLLKANRPFNITELTSPKHQSPIIKTFISPWQPK